jgi:acetyl esterase
VSSHYRQAPEHTFPASHEDAFAAYQGTLANAKSLNGDPKKFAVVGESAGGNMAAAVAMMAHKQNVQMPVHQVLIYPVAHYGFDTPSYQQNENAQPLNEDMMKWFFSKYLKSPTEGENAWISLVEAKDLQGLPSATIITAEIDPLRSEGQMYANRLREAGVQVDYKNYDGVAHEFFGMGAIVDKAKEAVSQAGGNLKTAFNTESLAAR